MVKILAFLLLLSISFSSLGLPKKIVIGFNSGSSGADFQDKASAFAKILEKKLNIPIETYISPDYDSLTINIKKKKIDFAFFTAFTYVSATQEVPLKVLLKSVWKSPYYYSAIVTHPKSDLKDISQLKEKKFAFVDKNSLSGYLLPKQALAQAGVSEKKLRPIFTGNHKASIKTLYDREVDAVAVFANDSSGNSGAWTELFETSDKHPVKVLWVSKSVPTDPFCVREEFYKKYPQLSHDLMFQLLEMEMNSNTKGKLKEYLGITRMVTATGSQYDIIKKLIPKK